MVRGGSERDITVTVAKRPGMQFENGNFEWKAFPPMGEMPKMPQMPDISKMPKMPQKPEFQLGPNGDGNFFIWRGGGRQIGVGLTPLTKQLGDYFGVADGNGMLITSVRENSPAAKAGLKAGDVIVEMNGKPVKGDFDMMRELNEKKDGDVELTIIRDRNRQTVRVTPEEAKANDLSPLLEQYNTIEGRAPMVLAPGAPRGLFAAPGKVVLATPGRIL